MIPNQTLLEAKAEVASVSSFDGKIDDFLGESAGFGFRKGGDYYLERKLLEPQRNNYLDEGC
jgi:hypothetical protein